MASRFASLTSEEIIQIFSGVYYLTASRLGKYPPLATDIEVNSS